MINIVCLCTFSVWVPVAELHGLCRCGSFVQQGGVRHGHARDVTDHGLIIEERLQTTLGDLGLVRRVLGHPEDKTRNESDERVWTHGQRDKVVVNQGAVTG